ncbi:MAG: hypothetical protein WC505_05680 [Patescibacteria group bacterium]
MAKKPDVKPVPCAGALRVNVYALLTSCVEIGIETGWQHAHKHTDTPDKAVLCDQIYQDIVNEICEYFTFDLPGEHE